MNCQLFGDVFISVARIEPTSTWCLLIVYSMKPPLSNYSIFFFLFDVDDDPVPKMDQKGILHLFIGCTVSTITTHLNDRP